MVTYATFLLVGSLISRTSLQDIEKVLPESCTIQKQNQDSCRVGSQTICTLIGSFQLTRQLNRQTEFDVSWNLNGSDLSLQAHPEISAGEMTQDCTTCSATLHIQTFDQRFCGTYEFEIRRILPVIQRNSIREVRTKCLIRLCGNNQDAPRSDIDINTGKDSKGEEQSPYVYIIGGICLLFFITTFSLVLKIMTMKQNDNDQRQSNRNQQQASQISEDGHSLAVSNHIYASVHLNPASVNYQALVRNVSGHRYDQPYAENNSSEVPGPAEDEDSLTSYSEHSRGVFNDQLPDVVVHDYNNIRRQRRLT